MYPPLIGSRKLLVVQGRVFKPVLYLPSASCIWSDNVDRNRYTERYNGEVEKQLKESSLEQEVQVSISATIGDPVVHVEFADDACEEVDEHIKGFCLVENLSLIDLLNIEVLIDRYLHFRFLKHCCSTYLRSV